MSDELPSKRLAEWLDSPAGTDPPEGVDPEVLAAVFALTPNRAPAPRVSIDDILAGVESGPFATSGAQAPTTDNVVRFPGNDVPEPAVGTKTPRRVRRPSRIWWAMPALGFGLAAAAAVMLIFPLAGKLSRPDVAQQEAAAPAAPTATASLPAEEQAEGADPTDGLPTADAPAPVIPEMAPAQGRAEELAKDAEKKAPAADPDATDYAATERPVPAPAEPPPPPPARTPTTISELAAGPAAGGSADAPAANQAPAASAAAPSTGSWAEESAGATVPGKARANSARSLPTTTSPPAPTPTADGSIFKEEEDDFEMPTTTTKSSASASSSASRSRSQDLADAGDEDASFSDKGEAKRESRKDKAPAMPKISAKPAPAPVEAQATSAGARRGYGSALDYDPDWYTSVPEVVPAYNAALAYESTGQWDQAATAWKALMSHARADVAQDAAYRAGKALRAAGRANEALAAVDQGLRRSSGNTAIRSRLSSLRADLLADLGQIKASKSATEDAEELDQER